MQRNMDLVRMILTRLETTPPGGRVQPDMGIQSFSAQEIAYHVRIMMQEGLIEGVDVSTIQGSGAIPTGLTWKGHELLDLARDPDRWDRAKAVIAKVGGAPTAVWMKVLTDLMLLGVQAVTPRAS